MGCTPSNGRPGLRMAVRRKSQSRGCELRLHLDGLYARSVCDLQRRCSCNCCLWPLHFVTLIIIIITIIIIIDNTTPISLLGTNRTSGAQSMLQKGNYAIPCHIPPSVTSFGGPRSSTRCVHSHSGFYHHSHSFTGKKIQDFSLFQDPRKIFPGPFRSPRTLKH